MRALRIAMRVQCMGVPYTTTCSGDLGQDTDPVDEVCATKRLIGLFVLKTKNKNGTLNSQVVSGEIGRGRW